MANALKRGPLVQLLKSLFTGGTDVTTTTSTTSSYRFPDMGNVVEGIQSYTQHHFSHLKHHVHGSSWLSHFLESVLVIGVATALVIVYRDDQKWTKIVTLFSVGTTTTTNSNSEEQKVGIHPSFVPFPPLFTSSFEPKISTDIALHFMSSLSVLTSYPPLLCTDISRLGCGG